MGCTASKLDNEDTVRRCKERRRFMKDAVHARHHLAAAHSDYCRSLRLTGSSLVSFAAGEPLSVSDSSPSVLLPTHSNSFRSNPPPPPRVPSPSLHPPPPPPLFTPSPTIASPKLPHILSSSSLHSHRPKPVKVKLPHILSESSRSSSPQHHHNKSNHYADEDEQQQQQQHYTYKANATYSNTPSQASSVWNWENFYPPSPPDSEFFNNRHNNNEEDKASVYSNYEKEFKPPSHTHDDKASLYSNYEKINPQIRTDDDKASVYSNYSKANRQNEEVNHHFKHNHPFQSEEDEETEREEVQCSEWDDHYSTTSSSDEEGDRESRSEIGTRSNFGSSVHNEPMAVPQPAANSKFSKTEKSDDAGSSMSWNAGGNREIGDMKMVVRHRDLAEIVAAIKEHFDKAAGAGEQVSEMLETGRAQLDRSFSKLKKTVYHSSGVFSNLSSSWSSKPPLAVKYRFEPGSIDEPGGPKSLCSTLERLLAWEKKLYQEVKAREGVKIEHEKKLSALQSQEYKGDMEKLDKTKASIKRLQFMYMWRSMNQFHEVQNHIVQQVRGLVNRSTKGESTSDLHRQATRDLESAVATWHSSFCRLIKFQREFIRSLNGWFKLTYLPITTTDQTTNNKIEPSDAYTFCDEWKLSLDRLPDTVASEAIKSFINVVHSISLKQTEEIKIKKRTESASKELEKKASSLRNIEKKYYHSYSMVGIGLPDSGPDNGHGLDARDPLSEKKSELATCQRRVEDEMLRHSKAVEVTRAMTLNNIQTGLPGVFQAMTSFSGLFVEALEVVCNRSYAIK
ncbi:hypothetical protein LguiA_010224 [Lonicera macranthoides]